MGADKGGRVIEGENGTFELVRCGSDADWREQRTKGIGGSDVASIMGLSPWRTPLELWLEKTGRDEPEDISGKPFVRFGNLMEPEVGRVYKQEHPDRIVRRVNAICRSIARPWAQASLDYEVRDGEWGVLEIKTARSAQDWQDRVPPYYLTQVTHYLSVTGRPFADVCVFFRDTCEFRTFRVDRDEDDVRAVDAAVDDFWCNYVLEGVAPSLVGTDGEARALTSLHGSPTGDIVRDMTPEANELVSSYQDASRRERQARADKVKAADELMARIGDARGLVTDTSMVTWVRSESSHFDAKMFQRDHADLYDEYVTTSRRNGGLRMKEI